MKRTIRLAAHLIALFGAVGAVGANADGDGDGVSSWDFSGFGTVGAVMTDTDEAQFHASTRQSHGAGKTPTLGVDSRLGLQATVKFNETLSAVGQLLISDRDGLSAQAEWLYGQASVTPWLKLRAGRMVLPVFLVSEFRNVGYAAHWVRAPMEVYGLYPASAFDGGQAQVQVDWGDTHFTLQASVGTSKVDLYAFNTRLSRDLKNLYSLNLVVERGDWTLRLGETEARNTELTGLAFALAPFTDSFRGAGVAYDDGRLLLQAEYVTRRTSNDGAFDMSGYYATGGYRMGAWTPYATYGRYKSEGRLLAGTPGSRTVAAGLRWDAFRDVAIKAQVESTRGNGFKFVNASPEFAAGTRKVNVFTVLVDFVF